MGLGCVYTRYPFDALRTGVWVSQHGSLSTLDIEQSSTSIIARRHAVPFDTIYNRTSFACIPHSLMLCKSDHDAIISQSRCSTAQAHVTKSELSLMLYCLITAASLFASTAKLSALAY